MIAHETDHLGKAIEAAPDADALRQCLLGWKQDSGLPIHATLAELGKTLVRAYPQVDGERINHLLAELDASLYGGAQALELEAWKQSFRTELERIGRRKPFHAVPYGIRDCRYSTRCNTRCAVCRGIDPDIPVAIPAASGDPGHDARCNPGIFFRSPGLCHNSPMSSSNEALSV